MSDGAAPSKLQLKSSYRSVSTIEAIYTGGPCAVTRDEAFLFCTVNTDVYVVSLEDGRKKAELAGDSEVVTALAIKPNGQQIVTASRSLQLRVWDLSTYKTIRSFKVHEAPVIVMTIDETSTLVATGSADSTVKVWDIDGGYCTHNFRGHSGVVSAIQFHPDPKRLWLATGADDCQVRVWDLNKSECIAVLDSHVSVVRGLAFTSNDDHLISGSRDKVVNVWNLKNKSLAHTFPVYEGLETVGLIDAGTVINGQVLKHQAFYTGGEKGTIRVWDYTSGELLSESANNSNAKFTFTDVLHSKSSGQLYGITSDQNILIYQLADCIRPIRQLVGYNDEIIDLAYLGEDESYLAVITNSEQIRVFDLETFSCDIVYGHADTALCVAHRPKGDIMVTAGKDRTARVWSVNMMATTTEDRFKLLGTCVGHTESIGSVAVPNRSDDFIITVSQDRTVKYWDLTAIDVTSIAPDSGYKIKSQYTHQAHDKDINTVSIAPNDKLFVTGSQDKTAKVWSCADGSLVGVCKGHKRGVWCARFSPMDQVLVTSSGDKTVRLWSLTDFSCIKTFEGHTSSVLRVAFLTAGTQLISSGSDGLIKLWNIKSNECIDTVDEHEDKIWALTVRSDENRMASGSADSTIHIWQDFTQEDREEERQKQADLVEKEQVLSNYLLKKDYKNAILLALSLEQPHRLLSLFKDVLDQRSQGVMTTDSITGSIEIDEIIKELDTAQLSLILGYIRDWNTNAKKSRTAQTILHAILKSRRVEELQQVTNIKELTDSMIPFTDRHFARLDALLTQSYIVDYTLRAMDRHGPVGNELLTHSLTATSNMSNGMVVDTKDD
ncbi:WD40-repeat-containing domain protein [Syncephalis fuscata]|nr:WD40-repeat-containing domain protein [Syncephalis fuscata]